MNLRKIEIIGLACCAFVLSCGSNDTQISYNEAVKYVEEHYSLPETTTTAKSGKYEWNFKDSTETTAKKVFEYLKTSYFKDTTIEYKVSGSADLNDKTLESAYVMNKAVITELKNKDNYTFYTNGSGLKTVYKQEKTSTFIGTYTIEDQYDNEGKELIYLLNFSYETS